MTPTESSWLLFPHANPTATKRIFCFHYAGGSALAFYPWAKLFDSTIELVCVQLPGHGTRFTEPLLKSMPAIIDSLLEEFSDYVDKPYYLYGHSLGGLIAFELTHRLQLESQRMPNCLIISGKAPPHLDLGQPISHLPDEAFIEETKKYDGMPAEILENRDILNLWMPILRADFEVLETYIPPPEHQKLSCDLVTLGGLNDVMVPPSHILQWQKFTSKGFKSSFFPGNHFFIAPQQKEVTALISNVILNGLQG
ncbi:MAG: thioesterase [Alphaproteobacteria bacterium]|nr:thioesterase [Alphaproteobacteria bacterium]